MKRSAEVAFVQEEVAVVSQPVLPHLQTTATAGPVPASKSPDTRKTPRRASRGSTTLRRGPTSHERDEPERAKAAAAAHWILNNTSPEILQSPHLSQKRQKSSNALALRLGSPVAGPSQPATIVVPPAISRANQRSNVIRRAKPFVDIQLPEELAVPLPHSVHKRQKTCTSCGSNVDENGNAIPAAADARVVNTISFSQAFIEAGKNILSKLGLGKWVPNSGASAAQPPAQVETNAPLPQPAQVDNDVEMLDATVNPIQETAPFNLAFTPCSTVPIPYSACPSPSAYTPEQWARLSLHHELARSRYTESTYRIRANRKTWEDSGRHPSANPRCHLVRTMTPSRLSKEIFPQRGDLSSGLLTSHPSLASTASVTSTVSVTSNASTVTVDAMDQLPSTSTPPDATLQTPRDVQYFPSSNKDYEGWVLAATLSPVENENARWNFYPLFTGKTPGMETSDTLRKTTLLSNWGHWLHKQNIWDLLWDREMETVMVWHNRYPKMPLPPPSPFVVAARGAQRKQIVQKASEVCKDNNMEICF